MEDRVLISFLVQQQVEGAALALASDLLDLQALVEGDAPARRYVARFHCVGLVRSASGKIAEASSFHVGIWFPDDYLRRADPFQVVAWLGPAHVWHPNIAPPFQCIGRVTPGTALVDLLHRCHEVITYQRVTMREDDALNHPACAWARENRERFPVDARPLKRRALRLQLVAPGEAR